MIDSQLKTSSGARGSFWLLLLILAAILAILFHRSFERDYVLFSNDGPLGAISSKSSELPSNFFGFWQDLNWVGGEQPSGVPNISVGLNCLLGPVWFSKIYVPIALFILGIGAWVFFRQSKFFSPVAILGAIAAVLNANILSNATWGLPSRAITVGLAFLALAALRSVRLGEKKSWIKIALAGFAVGLGVMEAYDVGALFSLYVAGFAFFWFWQQKTSVHTKVLKGGIAVAMMAICAAFISVQAVSTLVRTQLKGAVSLESKENPEAKWNFSTQWSLPKVEIFRVIVPGLFGYRMDSPDGAQYWGRVGQSTGVPTSRFSGADEYAGVLVVMGAIFAVAQSFRKKNPLLSDLDRRMIKFWTIAAVISVLFAFGRYAPFYHLIYPLPFFSSMRNPMKFMHPFNMALLVLFGYGLQLLYRGYIEPTITRAASPLAQIRKTLGATGSFERKWQFGILAAIALSVLGFMIYSSSRQQLESYLQTVGFNAQASAPIASFSIHSVGWYLLYLVMSGVVILLITSGWFSRRFTLVTVLLGVILVADLARANAPWIIYWNYKEKYASNPVIDFLQKEPYLHRVTVLPIQHPDLAQFQMIYGIEWTQHLFPYYNVQSLDVVQEPRPAEDNMAYRQKFGGSFASLIREWQLTNTRYIFGLNGNFVDMLNQQVDPVERRFRVALAFDLVPKPGIAQPSQAQDITAVLNPNGRYALIEFTGALPRAKLYSNWEILPNEQAALDKIAEPDFNPQKAVVVTSEANVAAPQNPTAEPGSVDITGYAPKHVELSAKANSASILLLNDKYHPDWKVTVDGQPAHLFRANYLMRGILLQPGEHKIVFDFRPPITPFYVSLAAIGVGIVLCGILGVSLARKPKENSTN